MWYPPLGISLPLSHPLALLQADHHLYNAPPAEIARALSVRNPDLTVIDIGANVGDTAAQIRLATSAPILCVEGEPRFFELLTRNHRLDDAIVSVAAVVSDRNAVAQAVWQPYPGNAVLSSTATGARMRLRTLTSVVDEFPRFARSRLVKIDAEGHDVAILRGAHGWFETVCPVVFLEYNAPLLAAVGDGFESLRTVLSRCGYALLQLFRSDGAFVMQCAVDDRAELERLRSRCLEQSICDLAAWPPLDAPLAAAVARRCSS